MICFIKTVFTVFYFIIIIIFFFISSARRGGGGLKARWINGRGVCKLQSCCAPLFASRAASALSVGLALGVFPVPVSGSGGPAVVVPINQSTEHDASHHRIVVVRSTRIGTGVAGSMYKLVALGGEDRKSGFGKGKKWPRKTLLGLDPRQRQSLACTFLGELKGSRWLARHISAAGQCERVRAGPREDEPSR